MYCLDSVEDFRHKTLNGEEECGRQKGGERGRRGLTPDKTLQSTELA